MNETTDKHYVLDLSNIPTADLVRELCSREGVEYMDVPAKCPHLSRHWSVGDKVAVGSYYLLSVAFACGFNACIVFSDLVLLGVDNWSIPPAIIFGAFGYKLLTGCVNHDNPASQ